MKEDIAIISPDDELLELVKEIRNHYVEPIKLVKGYLDEGVKIAKELERNGVKVLISRGKTTAKIRQSSITIPVIDIPITEYDVICLLDKAKKISKSVAVVGFDSLVNGAKEIAPFIDIHVKTFRVTREDELITVLNQINSAGIKVVIGSKTAVKVAQKFGIYAIPIRSQLKVVRSALDEGIKVLNTLRKERELGERLNVILDSIDDGIVSVDEKGKITHFNIGAKKILDKVNNLLIGKPIGFFLNNNKVTSSIQKGERWKGNIQDIHGKKYVCNLNPISLNKKTLGSIIRFQEVSHLQGLEQKIRKKLYQKGHFATYDFSDILTCNSRMKRLVEKAKYYSKVNSTVLIRGESGTGKELFAQSLHNSSDRSSNPFVAVNCAALPENILESELFGYVEGAFTGAKKTGKPGLFELGHNGTLFLDEIGEVSLSVQARLLRVLEEKQVMRIGDDKVIPIDTRIICATNKDLRELVEKKLFREDLYYRINVLQLEIPPLRKRKEDIPLLLEYFTSIYSEKLNKKKPIITPEAMDLLINHGWPGNIRELRNVAERLMINVIGQEISGQLIKDVMGDELTVHSKHGRTDYVQNQLKENELNLIQEILKETKGNKVEAAKRLGISRTTLWRRIKVIKQHKEF